ncbi:zinc finger protein 14 homolog [Strongylocentrotus purpuratus]|uniref:C2H2-type domain-containing protein n=1 Tax=Strongylocentrotus purpuratus TaxID=7668 RepID=A0A7M7PC38_STRPU|nr:zinc finger protein 14 homolog [Strongylocentrotus purpuratus]
MNEMMQRSNMEVFNVKFIKEEPQTSWETSSNCQAPVVVELKDQTECLQEVGSPLQKKREHIATKEEDHDLFSEVEEGDSNISKTQEEKVHSTIQEDHGSSSRMDAERATSRQSSLANDSHQVYQYQMGEEKILTSEHNGSMYSVFEERTSMTEQREEIDDGWSLNETRPFIRTPDVSLSRSYLHHGGHVEEIDDGSLLNETSPFIRTPDVSLSRSYSHHEDHVEEIDDGSSLNKTSASIRTPDVCLSRSYSHHEDQVEEIDDGSSLNETRPSIRTSDVSLSKSYSHHQDQVEENSDGWLPFDTNPSLQTPGQSGERPYSCHHCGKRFASKQAVNSHMQFHKPYHCPKCNKGYYAKEELAEHMDTHNSAHAPKIMYHCTYMDCDKEFPTHQGLSRHMQGHPQEKPFECSECHKGFGTQIYLNAHMKLHSREAKFHCAECGEGFFSRGSLC